MTFFEIPGYDLTVAGTLKSRHHARSVAYVRVGSGLKSEVYDSEVIHISDM